MRIVYIIVFAALQFGCASNEATQTEQPKSTTTTQADSRQVLEDKLLSVTYGLLTPEQDQRFQEATRSNKKTISVWPVFEQNLGKLDSIYEPNAIASTFSFPKPLRLKYQDVIDYQIVKYSKTKLADEDSASLHFYTLFSTAENGDGTLTIEYMAGVSDWQVAKKMTDKPSIVALLETTIWSVIVREIATEDMVKTSGKLDENKLIEFMIKMSVPAMQHFLVVDNQKGA